ncbi:pentatricopeptide repeat-containing protein At5g04780, mitochondrial-like isoform X2 [Salvia hispanica]|uniref:pentatricopeptide repeat-containing protein At5g04780, mitochondrial-like isoform X2 n=1 Tax=Salvia hispanica TaxID=49212 RepID=UPI00200918AF|nr:pentatricopeptide repeat-containing protein At5g04780, mitochondrial-like isoform X2 [Salvia hispanica]
MHAVIDTQKNHGMHFRVLAKRYLEKANNVSGRNLALSSTHPIPPPLSFCAASPLSPFRSHLFNSPMYKWAAGTRQAPAGCWFRRCITFTFHKKRISTKTDQQNQEEEEESHSHIWVCTRQTFLQIQQTIVQKCAKQRAIQPRKSSHAQIILFGLQSDTSTSNMLINFYSKCGAVDHARKVFDEMRLRSVVSWNTMIGAYTQNGNGEAALSLFARMLRQGSEFSEFALSSVLCACASNFLPFESKQLHALVVKSSMESNVFVGTALLDVYAKCRFINDALHVFEAMPEKSDVTWSSMMAGFVQNDLYEEAFRLFLTAQRNGVKMNVFMISSVLCASAALAALVQGKQVHAVVCKAGFGANEYVVSSLVDVYARCGSINQSHSVFSEAEKRNVILWNTMISGFARHARPLEAMMLFEKMQQAFLYPNEEQGLNPGAVHYLCMVDILGRTRRIDEAKDMIEKMPFEATASMWGSLLASCRVHKNVEVAEVAARKLFKIEPNNAGNHVLLSNVYAASGRWDDVASARKLLKSSEVKKERGKSWIEIKDSVHSFMVGERSHPRMGEIYARLDDLLEEMEKSGFRGLVEHDLHDVEDECKRELLKHHSEKLAFTFGLMCLPWFVPIRIMKNLRICGDCHQFMKVASAVTGREIVVRDNNRFHHFREGVCSCGEFW